MTTIATVSDIHGQWRRLTYPPADVLIFAGDIFKNYSWDREEDATKQLDEVKEFAAFFGDLRVKIYKHIIVVAGNHDFVFERRNREAKAALLDQGLYYLENSALTVDGVKYYGSPYQPFFFSWAFNFPNPAENEMRAMMAARNTWKKIPDNTNVLITHGPPRGILDICFDGRKVGCAELRKVTDRLVSNGSLKLHIFGHIHHSAGIKVIDQTIFKNTAMLGEDYMFLRDITIEEV